MDNRLQLIELPTTETLSHGASNKKHRHHNLLANGVVIRTFYEDGAQDNYAVGKSYDQLIENTVERFEEALGCKVERISRKHWTNDLKAKVLELLHPGDLDYIEWSGVKVGPGSGPHSSGGDGDRSPACPVCGGLKEKSPGFIEEAVGHREGCELDRLLNGKL